MKFFLEFVSCCGCSPVRKESEEKKSLVAAAVPLRACRLRRRKRGRPGTGGSTCEWRPSLSSISEDDVLMEQNQLAITRLERSNKRKVASPARSRAPPRQPREEVGGAPLSAMLPVYSPSAFMF